MQIEQLNYYLFYTIFYKFASKLFIFLKFLFAFYTKMKKFFVKRVIGQGLLAQFDKENIVKMTIVN